jgi:hypothetical protein
MLKSKAKSFTLLIQVGTNAPGIKIPGWKEPSPPSRTVTREVGFSFLQPDISMPGYTGCGLHY